MEHVVDGVSMDMGARLTVGLYIVCWGLACVCSTEVGGVLFLEVSNVSV